MPGRRGRGLGGAGSSRSGAYREDLRRRIEAARAHTSTAMSSVLESTDGLALFEGAPELYLRGVLNPKEVAPFRKLKAVTVAAAWLKRRGIDVLFVPVPKMTEVYPEHFAAHCPADRIIGPHLRHLLVELLQDDVEVVDLLPLFLRERDKSPEPLYQSADPHWTPRGQAVGARAIAERLRRYDFVAKAQAARPAYKVVKTPFPPMKEGGCYQFMTTEQRERAATLWPATFPQVMFPQGDPSGSPARAILTIGDSYNGGLVEQLSKEVNLPVETMAGAGQSTGAFKFFLREPESLNHRKVLIWLICSSTLCADWTLPPAIAQTPQPQSLPH